MLQMRTLADLGNKCNENMCSIKSKVFSKWQIKKI